MDEERRLILKMIQEGKVTADEGAALLEALEDRVVEEEEAGTGGGRAATGSATEEPASGGADFDGDEHKSHEQDEVYQRVARRLEDARERIEAKLKGAEARVEREVRRSSADVDGLVEGINRGIQGILSEIPNMVQRGAWKFDLGGSGTTHSFEETFTGHFESGEEPLRAEFEVRNGNIQVDTWDQPGYKVEVVKKVRAASDEDAQRRAAELVVWTPGPGGIHLEGRDSRGDKVEVQVYLPTGRTYEIRSQTVNGRIDCRNLIGTSLEVESVNGLIQVRDVRVGDLRARSTNGRLVMERVSAETLEGKTVNGSVRLQGIVAWAKCKTLNGTIDLFPMLASVPQAVARQAATQGSAATGIGESPVQPSSPASPTTPASPAGESGWGQESGRDGWPSPPAECGYEMKTSNGAVRIHAPVGDEAGYRFELKTFVGRISLGMQGLNYEVNEHGVPGAKVRAASPHYEERTPRIYVEAKTQNGSITVQTPAE